MQFLRRRGARNEVWRSKSTQCRWGSTRHLQWRCESPRPASRDVRVRRGARSVGGRRAGARCGRRRPSAPGVASGPVAGAAQAPRAEELAAFVVALTAPEMEGRGSGTVGGDRAARYLADRLAASGFRPGGDAGTFFSWFPVGSTARAAAGSALKRMGPAPGPLALGRDWAPHGGSLAGDAAGEVVFVGYGLAAPDGGPGDYAGVSGKIALALDGGAPGGRPSRLGEAHRGAATRRGRALDRGRYAPFPRGHGDLGEARVRVRDAGRRGRAARSRRQEPGRARVGPGRTGAADRGPGAAQRTPRPGGAADGQCHRHLPSAGPARASEVVVLGAHYDHLGRAGGVVHPGADDNASGTAVVLGMAQALAAAGGTARTLVVVFFSGEEIGLLGSAHYVKHPPLPLRADGRHAELRHGRPHAERSAQYRRRRERGWAAHARGEAHGRRPARPRAPRFPVRAVRPRLVLCGGRAGAFLSHRRPRRLSAPGDTADKINAAGMAQVARLGLRIAERLGGEARPPYVALARPDGASRGGSGRGGDSGGAFLGVSVDGRSGSDGVRLGSVVAGSGAERAGLRGGDVIVRMGIRG